VARGGVGAALAAGPGVTDGIGANGNAKRCRCRPVTQNGRMLPTPAPTPGLTSGTALDTAPVLRLSGISKRFGPVLANDNISLDLARAEVLALLGENGAGKSTLVSILFGHYLADAGHIEVDGQRLPPGQPRAALAAGIGMVHQHFTLADNLSVLDNVLLGTESLWSPKSQRAAARAHLLSQAERFGLAVDPEARVGALSVGERQRVEILKALFSFGKKTGARVLILDEPTAVLTPQESESLFATLQQMVGAGLSIIFISHKLDEVLRVSQRIAVLRGGRLVATEATSDASKGSLALAMVGHSVAAAHRVPVVELSKKISGIPMCVLRGATLRADKHRWAGPASGPRSTRALLDAVDLQVHACEVLAIAGVSGNGQAALAEVLCGERALHAGSLHISGRALPSRQQDFVEAGVARIPEDRHHVGLVGDLVLWENAVLEHYRSPAFSWAGWVKRSTAKAHMRSLIQRFDMRGTEGGGEDTITRRLSGGNLQKLILARVLGRGLHHLGAAPPLIVANQPTWGLDIGAVAYVHQQLLDAAAAGSAVIVISEDLDEVFALADRIAVMHQGRLTAARPTAQWTRQALGLAMAGAGDQPSHSPKLDHGGQQDGHQDRHQDRHPGRFNGNHDGHPSPSQDAAA
jgi:general nucleoside transport system ATP-binding protein